MINAKSFSNKFKNRRDYRMAINIHYIIISCVLFMTCDLEKHYLYLLSTRIFLVYYAYLKDLFAFKIVCRIPGEDSCYYIHWVGIVLLCVGILINLDSLRKRFEWFCKYYCGIYCIFVFWRIKHCSRKMLSISKITFCLVSHKDYLLKSHFSSNDARQRAQI